MSLPRISVVTLVLAGIIARALAQEPAPAPPPSPPPAPLATWTDGEGFRIQSRDGNWRLRVGLQAAVVYQPQFFPATGNDWSNFGFTYVRPRLSGHLLRPWLQYWCSLELRNFPPYLLDCWVQAKPWSFFGVRGGQFQTPQSRHQYLGPQEIVFPDRDTVSAYFWTNRDRGVQLFGETSYLDYYASFTAGTSLTQVVSTTGNFQLVGRVSLNPLGALGKTEMPFVASEEPVPLRFSVGLQGSWGRVNPNGVGFNPDTFFTLNQQGERDSALGGADLLAQWWRFGFFSEFYARHIEPRDGLTPSFEQYGFWAQGHVTFFRRILDLAARFDWIDPSHTLANDRFLAGEVQLAWFIYGPTLALRLRYAIAHQQNPGPAPAALPDLLTTVGLPIPPGTEQLVTLQVQLAL
ncbi:MAG TPA: hypothetical protein VN947_04900 [Polyangia bacterium]|nr:hypothetical protein [Polyangia bacterium]